MKPNEPHESQDPTQDQEPLSKTKRKAAMDALQDLGVILVGAQAVSGLTNRTVRVVACDQVDQWPEDVQGQGDPLKHAELRCATYGARRKIYITGPPSILGRSRIHREFLKTDQRRYFIPCPSCGHMDFLTWQGKDWWGSATGLHHSIHLPEKQHGGAAAARALEPELDPDGAAMRCAGCAELIPERWSLPRFGRGR